MQAITTRQGSDQRSRKIEIPIKRQKQSHNTAIIYKEGLNA